MPNDAKLGLVVGVGLVLAIAAVFHKKDPTSPFSLETSTPFAEAPLPPPRAPVPPPPPPTPPDLPDLPPPEIPG